jgi:hypothetical protein
VCTIRVYDIHAYGFYALYAFYAWWIYVCMHKQITQREAVMCTIHVYDIHAYMCMHEEFTQREALVCRLTYIYVIYTHMCIYT